MIKKQLGLFENEFIENDIKKSFFNIEKINFKTTDDSHIYSIINNINNKSRLLKKHNGEFYTKNKKILSELESNVDLGRERFYLVDPSCGKGDILTHFIKKFIEYWKDKKSPSAIIENIFCNFYGFDINSDSCLLAKYNIYKLLKKYFVDKVINNYDFNQLNILSFDFTIKENTTKYLNFFDYVIGNPPFITYYGKHSKPLTQNKKQYYISNYEFIKNKNKDNRLNSSMFFIENGLNILKYKGILKYIMDISFFEPPYQQIRKYIKKYNILNLIDKIEGFNDVYSGQIIVSMEKNKIKNKFVYWKDFETKKTLRIKSNLFDFKKPLNDCDKKIIRKIENKTNPLIYHFDKKEIRTCAVLTGRTNDFVFNKVNSNSKNNFYPFLEGAKGLPERFKLNIPNNRFLEYNYRKQLTISDEFKVELEKRGIKNKKRIGLGDEQSYKNPKIFIRQSAKKLICAYTEKQLSSNNSIYVIFKRINNEENRNFLKFLSCLLNSEILTFYALKKNIIRLQKGKIPQIRLSDLYKLPIITCHKQQMAEITKCVFGGKKDINKTNYHIAELFNINNAELKYILDYNKSIT